MHFWYGRGAQRVKLMVHEQIEELRIQMQEIASGKDLTDPREGLAKDSIC